MVKEIKTKSKIRKWGNSYGVLIPKEKMIKANFHENEIVIVEIKKKKDLSSIFGICHFKRPVKQIVDDIKEGYDE
ncbi:AbrB/MazE/SpoVT family DNA-binding domain-containing protein [Candidatus Woesearchaeota archaeon]|nr:AbrB/MazE/SpoVT family DNA-binding domain-containing protein [Candidatus Woesearchaeota archaeon]